MKIYWIILIITAIVLVCVLIERDRRYKSAVYLKSRQIKSQLDKIPKKYNPDISMRDIFDNIYLISLPERKFSALRALNSFNIYPHIIEPVLKANLDHEELIGNGIVVPEYNYGNLGRVACHLSHINTLLTFLDDPNAQTAVIFEDDIEECQNKSFYQKRLSALKDELRDKKDWDVIYLGFCWSFCEQYIYVTNQLCKGGAPKCRHAYAVTRKGAELIINNTLPMYHNGDNMMADMEIKNSLNALSLVPPIFFQKLERNSTLGNNKSLQHCSGPIDIDLHKLNGPSILVIVPSCGLGNRLLAIASAMKLAFDTNRKLIVVWEAKTIKTKNSDDSLNADWEDLFDPSDYFSFVKNYTPSSTLSIKNPPGKWLSSDQCQKLGKEIYISNDHEIVVSNINKPLVYDQQFFTYFFNHILKFSQTITDIVRDFASNYFIRGIKIVGVHVRRTDHQKSIDDYPISWFIEQMHKQPSRITFFICSDDPQVKETMRKVFGSRIITFPLSEKVSRDNVFDIQTALIEILLLSLCSSIIRAHHSTFSQISCLIGDIPSISKD